MASCGQAMQAAGGSISWAGLKGEKCPVERGILTLCLRTVRSDV